MILCQVPITRSSLIKSQGQSAVSHINYRWLGYPPVKYNEVGFQHCRFGFCLRGRLVPMAVFVGDLASEDSESKAGRRDTIHLYNGSWSSRRGNGVSPW